MRSTRSDLDRVQRITVERGTRSRSEASLMSLEGVQALAPPGSWMKIWEEEVLSLRYVYPSISQLTSNSGPLMRIKCEIYFHKEVRFVRSFKFVNHVWLCFRLYMYVAIPLLGRSNGPGELNPFCFRRSYLLPFDPYCLSSSVNMRERYEITSGSENEGWLQIRENKCGNKLPLPEIAVTHSLTYIGRCILYHPNVFVLCK